MNILNQTTDHMTLKDSGGSSILPLIFFVVGVGGVYLAYTNAQTGMALIIPGIFALVAILMFLFKTTTIVDIDKGSGTIAFSRRSAVSNKSARYNIVDSKAIELREGSYVSSNTLNNQNTPQGISFGNGYNGNTYGNRTFTHQTVLVMNDGTELPLESIKSSTANSTFMGTGVLMSGRSETFAVSNQVAQFFGVPFNEVNQA